MKIVFAASEAAPFMKTGGLGDVAQALPLALSQYKNNQIYLFLPYYGEMKRNPQIEAEKITDFSLRLSWREQYVGVFRVRSRKKKLQIYLLDNEYYFDRLPIYGQQDDGERFAFFSKAILETLCRLNLSPDIIHCNDWQTAALPALLHSFYGDRLGGTKTIFTIHNIEYQGWADPDFLEDVLGLDHTWRNTFLWNGSVNLMKGALLCSDALTTVSHTYARQLEDPAYAHGLAPILSEHAFKMTGIVNGIDFGYNNPAEDSALAANYSAEDATSKKPLCKKALQQELNLPEREDVPLIGMVSRLVSHKGLNLICECLEEWLKGDMQFAILGTGDCEYENRLRDLADRYPHKFSLSLCFNKNLASRIYAGADLYLMPSQSEPCGLSQMIAMHYGTIPVVHETGGLKDTVIPYNPVTGEGLGFCFSRFDREDLLDAMTRALTLYHTDKTSWANLIKQGMTADFSWKNHANDYLSLYHHLCQRAEVEPTEGE